MSKILVIDDERPTLGMFRLFLTAYGHTPLTAESGEEGLEAFEREHPDIVLTDIKMPGMDGIEVLTRIKQLSPATEVIVITGHGDMDLAIKALNLDATDFINKPIQKNDLDVALKRAEERLAVARAKKEEIAMRVQDGVAVLSIQGAMTSASEPFLLESVERAAREGATRLLLSFDDSASVNGAGVAVLIQLLDRYRREGRQAAICGLSENFKRVFDIVGVARLAPIYPDEATALAALTAPKA